MLNLTAEYISLISTWGVSPSHKVTHMLCSVRPRCTAAIKDNHWSVHRSSYLLLPPRAANSMIIIRPNSPRSLFSLYWFRWWLIIITLRSGCALVKGHRRRWDELVSNCRCTRREGRRSSFEFERRWEGRVANSQRAGLKAGWFGRLREGGAEGGGRERERRQAAWWERRDWSSDAADGRMRTWELLSWTQLERNLQPFFFLLSSPHCFSSCCRLDEKVRLSSWKLCETSSPELQRGAALKPSETSWWKPPSKSLWRSSPAGRDAGDEGAAGSPEHLPGHHHQPLWWHPWVYLHCARQVVSILHPRLTGIKTFLVLCLNKVLLWRVVLCRSLRRHKVSVLHSLSDELFLYPFPLYLLREAKHYEI